jgi:hypothetical protein
MRIVDDVGDRVDAPGRNASDFERIERGMRSGPRPTYPGIGLACGDTSSRDRSWEVVRKGADRSDYQGRGRAVASKSTSIGRPADEAEAPAFVMG